MQKILSLACALLLAVLPVVAQAQQGVGGVPGPAYRINPGDDVEILVWGDERLQKVVRVLPDGTFGFPLVGQVMAAGQLPSDIQRIITAGLRPQYKDVVPQVTVLVKNPNGYQFSVIGKVKSPGTFTPGRYVNALDALTIAGGPTEFAQTGRIRIIRKVGQQLQTIPVQLGGALKGDVDQLGSGDIPPIQSGDTLVVP
jgi:polysaccharide export outer membrane protein